MRDCGASFHAASS